MYALESPQKPVGIGVVGELDVPVSSELLAENTKNALRAACVRTNRAKGQIQRVACVGGAGGDMVEEAVRAGADALVTGEAKHSHFLEAEAYGLLLVEAGHFDTEALFLSLIHI